MGVNPAFSERFTFKRPELTVPVPVTDEDNPGPNAEGAVVLNSSQELLFSILLRNDQVLRSCSLWYVRVGHGLARFMTLQPRGYELIKREDILEKSAMSLLFSRPI